MANNKVQIDINARNKTQRAFRQVNKSLSKTSKAVGLLVGALAASVAFAAVGVARFVSKSQKAINQMTDLSKRLGDSTESISAFAFAAEAAGVAITTSTDALQRQSRKIGEAIQGYGRAGDAIEQLGLNVNDLADLTPSAAFEKISGALQKVESQSLKLALAFEIWEDQGTELVQTLDQIAKFKALAETSGAIITPDEVKAARDIRDAFTELRAESKSLGQNLTVLVAPVFTVISNILEYIVRRFRIWTRAVIEFGQNFGLFAGYVDTAAASVKGLGNTITPVVDKFDKFLQGMKNQNEVLGLVAAGNERVAATVKVVQQAEQALGVARGGLNDEERKALKKQIDLADGFNATIKAREDAAKAQIDRQKALADAIKDAQQRQKQFADNIAATMTSAFNDAILKANSLRDIMKGLLQDIAQIVIRQAVLQPLSGAISGLLPTFATGGIVQGSGPVPILAHGGEEVLTRNNPRHSKNNGGGTVVNVINNTQAEAQVSEQQNGDMREMTVLIENVVAQSVTSNGAVGQSIQGSFGSRMQGVLR